jgi:hypothetical protein
MSLDGTRIEVGLTQLKQPTIFCANCHLEAARLETLDEFGIALFELRCPRPQPGGPMTLGTWQNEYQAASDIERFIEGKTRPKR